MRDTKLSCHQFTGKVIVRITWINVIYATKFYEVIEVTPLPAPTKKCKLIHFNNEKPVYIYFERYNKFYRVPFPGCRAAGAWRRLLTPSNVEVKERVELYLYSPSGPSRSVVRRPHHLFITV